MVSNCFGRTVRNMRSLAILLLLLPGGAACSAQPIPDGDPAVVLRISIVGDQREFHIGETIPLLLRSAVMRRTITRLELPTMIAADG